MRNKRVIILRRLFRIDFEMLIRKHKRARSPARFVVPLFSFCRLFLRTKLHFHRLDFEGSKLECKFPFCDFYCGNLLLEQVAFR